MHKSTQGIANMPFDGLIMPRNDEFITLLTDHFDYVGNIFTLSALFTPAPNGVNFQFFYGQTLTAKPLTSALFTPHDKN